MKKSTAHKNFRRAEMLYYLKQHQLAGKRAPAFGWSLRFANPYRIMAIILAILSVLTVIYFVTKGHNI